MVPTSFPLRNHFIRLASYSFSTPFSAEMSCWHLFCLYFLKIYLYLDEQLSWFSWICFPRHMGIWTECKGQSLIGSQHCYLINLRSVKQWIFQCTSFLTGFQLVELICLLTAHCPVSFHSLIWSYLTLFPILRLTDWGKKIISDNENPSPFLPSLRDALSQIHCCQLTKCLVLKASQTWVMTLSSPMAHYSLWLLLSPTV